MSEKKFGVAAIVDEQTIIINYGKRDGAEVGQGIKILSNHSLPIKDPFTEENLGKIYHIKAELTLSKIDNKFSYCTSKKQMNFGIGLGSGSFYQSQALRIDSKFLTREVTDEPIQVGDPIEISYS
ncbi:hypothetical protein J4760_04250 [Salinicoccus sp. ID82-1]|uniref:hypothetical protein n=1 Tax=Salinicoccus sp. ID82-1 TaxID=2820269 RepID=UPI001F29150E|nr:hypothetical protein [Salinicoccus sp. ID82-1]MCG1009264.1 hypothetical protein [Salinicoccus sp. ID82-1]